MNVLVKNVQARLPWDSLTCKLGNTQGKERIYISVMKDEIEKLGGTIGRVAGSQEPMDFRDVRLPGVPYPFDVDGKSTNKGSTFMFNDSLPSKDGYYMFIQVEHKSVVMKKGEDIMNTIARDMRMTGDEVYALLEERDAFIKTHKQFRYGTKDVFISSYARPSWTVKLPIEWFERRRRDTVSDISELCGGSWPRECDGHDKYCSRTATKRQLTAFYEALIQRRAEQEAAEPRSPVEQSVPYASPPSGTSWETPESV